MTVPIERIEVDTGHSHINEIMFVGTGKQVVLTVARLDNQYSARTTVSNLPNGYKQVGETRELYASAIQELQSLVARMGPINYSFATSDERMIAFGQNILPALLGCEVTPQFDEEDMMWISVVFGG